ncbi:MAG: hypothetical protein ACLU5J_13170 [Christensenellales bacterium]
MEEIKIIVFKDQLYKLINKDIIKEDFIRINYIFTDWRKSAAAQNEKYPLNGD